MIHHACKNQLRATILYEHLCHRASFRLTFLPLNVLNTSANHGDSLLVRIMLTHL